MATNGVTKCSICRTEAVLKTKRNHISVECNMRYHFPKITFNTKPCPSSISWPRFNPKVNGIFSFQSQNNLEWILLWRNRPQPSSERLLNYQTVNSSETLLPVPYAILAWTTYLFTNVKIWSKKKYLVHFKRTELQVARYVLNQHNI